MNKERGRWTSGSRWKLDWKCRWEEGGIACWGISGREKKLEYDGIAVGRRWEDSEKTVRRKWEVGEKKVGRGEKKVKRRWKEGEKKVRRRREEVRRRWEESEKKGEKKVGRRWEEVWKRVRRRRKEGEKKVTRRWEESEKKVRRSEEVRRRWKEGEKNVRRGWEEGEEKLRRRWEEGYTDKKENQIFLIVPRRLFFAAQQRIAITLSSNYYQKSSVSQRERIKKNMAQMSCKFGEIIKKL